ncbi:MAG: replication initiation protein [Paraclostridium sp.]
MKDEKKDIRILMKDNTLVKTKYELNLAENRLYNLILYKFQKDGQLLKCVLSQDEVKEVIKFKSANTVQGILDLLNKLSITKIFLEEKKANKKNSYWHNYNMINGFTYDDENNTFEIEATEKIYSLLKQKFDNGKYTPNNLNLFLSLKNYYAQRIYELLRLWSGTKTVINYNVEELKGFLMLEDAYPQYGNFKRRVIVPAIKELNNTGFFEIDFKENKVGRKVDSIDFIVKDLDKRKYFTTDDVVADTPLIEEVVVTCDDKVEKVIKVDTNTDIEDIFVPDEAVFTTGTLRRFKSHFKDIDFRNEYMNSAFEDAVMITLERDEVEKIKAISYKFFKGTLDNKIVEYRLEEQEELKHKEEMDMNW